MNRLLFAVVMLIMSVTTFAQDNNTTAQTTPSVGYLCNAPLPYQPDSLNVLFIGNSFSIDTATGLPTLFKDLNIKNVNVYVLYKGGSSLRQHYELFKSREKAYELYRYNINGEKRLEKSITINDAMSRFKYDVVVFQQYSMESGKYETYEPYLSKLVQAYNTVKIGSRTTFAFNETWAVSSKNKSISTYGSPEKMYKSICNSVKQMKSASGIDVIIPCGTAVQNARNMSSLIIYNELTRDDLHMDNYMGRYLTACTFFEAIITPVFGHNLRDANSDFGKKSAKNQVNFSNRDLLKKCARLAVANNYEVSEFVNQ